MIDEHTQHYNIEYVNILRLKFIMLLHLGQRAETHITLCSIRLLNNQEVFIKIITNI